MVASDSSTLSHAHPHICILTLITIIKKLKINFLLYGTSDIISGNMGDAVPPGTEANGGLATLKGPLLREVQKPLLFGNHQKQFQAFTLVVTIGKS